LTTVLHGDFSEGGCGRGEDAPLGEEMEGMGVKMGKAVRYINDLQMGCVVPNVCQFGVAPPWYQPRGHIYNVSDDASLYVCGKAGEK